MTKRDMVSVSVNMGMVDFVYDTLVQLVDGPREAVVVCAYVLAKLAREHTNPPITPAELGQQIERWATNYNKLTEQ